MAETLPETASAKDPSSSDPTFSDPSSKTTATVSVEGPALAWQDRSVSDCIRTAGSAGSGIILAGIAYPLILCAGLVLITIASGNASLPELVSAVLMFVLASLSICPIAALIGLMMATVIIPWLNAAFGFVLKARTLVAIVGGLAGFIPFAWMYFFISPWLEFWDSMFVSMFAGLAVLMGQYGAIWSCVRDQRNGSLRPKPDQPTSLAWQFSLVRLFSITAVIAVFLAFDRLIQHRLSAAVATYTVLQTLALLIDRIVAFRFAKERVQ